jgi:hypothetical protein
MAGNRGITRADIERENRLLLDRQRLFCRAADIVIAAWLPFPSVRAVALIGSVARPLRREVPRFQPFRRAGVELWHECGDLDLALWLDALDDLGALRRACDTALVQAHEVDPMFGVPGHQVDVFLFEPGGSHYCGRLCNFNRCPKGKRECLVPDCGRRLFLKQIEGFRPYDDILAPERTVLLFDRESGLLRCAADLPVTGGDEA